MCETCVPCRVAPLKTAGARSLDARARATARCLPFLRAPSLCSPLRLLAQAELDSHAEVLAEPIQTVMRRYGVEAPYEQLKALTRGQGAFTGAAMRDFVRTQVRTHPAIPAPVADALEALTPSTYLGIAPHLAASVRSRLK